MGSIAARSLVIVLLASTDVATALSRYLPFDYRFQQNTDGQRTLRLSGNSEIQRKIRTSGSEQSPISLRIDPQKGTIDKTSRNISPEISNEEVPLISDGFDGKVGTAQNPLESFHSLLRDSSFPNSNEDFKSHSQTTNTLSAMRSTITSAGETVRADFNDLGKASIQWKTMVDGNTSDFHGTGREMKFSTPSHISNPNLNVAIQRTGNLASSHIMDYSAFLTNFSMETSTFVPDLEITSFPTTSISIGNKKMLLKQTLATQQTLPETINLGPGTPIQGNYSNKIEISNTQTSEASRKNTGSENDFRKVVIFPTTDRTTIFGNTQHSTTGPTPELIIFPSRKNFYASNFGMKLSPIIDETGKLREKKVTAPNSGSNLTDSITEPKNNSGNGTLYFGSTSPVVFSAVDDREIPLEQKSSAPVRLTVRERISEFLRKTGPSDFSEDEVKMSAESQATIKNASSAELSQKTLETQFRRPSETVIHGRVTQEGKTPPNTFPISRHDLITSGADYMEVLKFEFGTSVSTQLPAHSQLRQPTPTIVPSVNATNSVFSLQTVKEPPNRSLLWLMIILIALPAIILFIFIRNADSLSSTEKGAEERKEDVCSSKPSEEGIQSRKGSDEKMK
ncbi:unnamed protein product [Litomosoides sigmodontis]|uniref:Uncharacterized protein n=1 Tax=Litomosoides sigmodontis TaxID=42156 RepID=A0A3P7JZI2_LITSI|nr:unnamed protein product [Litomosoides sigmodontis]